MAKSSGGRTFLLMLLVAVGIGLFIRFKCRAEKAANKPPPVVATPVTVTADAAVAAEPPIADARVDETPEVPAKPAYTGPDLFIGALSADKSRALLVTLESAQSRPAWLRVVRIDDGSIETDLELPAYGALASKPGQDVVDEMIRARAVLRGFPLGTGRYGHMASAPDGARGAFNAGDILYLVDGDKLGAKVALPAAYNPIITPDGTVFMRGYDGQLDDEGKYSLFAIPVTGSGKPKKIAGTDGYGGSWHLTKSNTLRIVVSHHTVIPPCVLDVSLTKPFRVLSKFCPEHAIDGSIGMSPNGDYISWTVEDEDATRHVKVMELDTKKETLDTTDHEGNVWVSDEGRVVFATNTDVTVWEPKLKSFRESTADIDYRCEWRNANEMVCADDGSVRVVAP